MKFISKNIMKLPVDDFINRHMSSNKDFYRIGDYISYNINSMNKEDLIRITIYTLGFNDEVEEKCFNQIKKMDAVPELIEYVCKKGLINWTKEKRPSAIREYVVNYFVKDKEIELTNAKGNRLCETIKRIIDDTNITIYELFINKVKEQEYIFRKLVHDNKSYRENKKNILSLIKVCNGLNDDVALMLAPYMLVVSRGNNIPYMLLINNTANKSVLKYEILSTYSKEIIAYYIFKTKDYDLLDKIFVNGDNYLKYCTEIYGKYDLIKGIKRFVREDYKFRYVDSNIKDYLESSNEMPNTKTKRLNN